MKTIAWWSGGITSAVACRLAIDLYDDERLYLDQLDPKSGYKSDIVLPECGLFCQVNFADIMSDRVISILSGQKSIYDAA